MIFGEQFFFYTDFLGSHLIDFDSAVAEEVQDEDLAPLTQLRYTTQKWVSLEDDNEKLSFN